MITASELAGFFAAHAVWCLSNADSFHPMLAYTSEDGQRKMERLVGEDAAGLVEYGRQQLTENRVDADDAVLLYDGRITTDSGKQDAIIIEMRCYLFSDAQAMIGIPYRPASTGRFLVHSPKLLLWQDCDDFDMDAAFEAFFRGIAAHVKGAEVWQASLDESR